MIPIAQENVDRINTEPVSLNQVDITQLSIDRMSIAKSFGSASKSYDGSARLQRIAGNDLLPWLPSSKDLTVLDLGSGTGFFTELLAHHYSQVIGFDISHEMLHFAKENRQDKILWLEGDAHNIPLKDNSIDFIYSNLVIQWFAPLDQAITEMLRVLKPGGSLIFTTLVDGTLHELKSSWQQVDDDQHVINFKTLSELNTLFDRVLNNKSGQWVEQKCQDIILEYKNVIHLARELKDLGANHLAQKQNRGLSGKAKWSNMAAHYKKYLSPNGTYPATYRLFSGVIVKSAK